MGEGEGVRVVAEVESGQTSTNCGSSSPERGPTSVKIGPCVGPAVRTSARKRPRRWRTNSRGLGFVRARTRLIEPQAGHGRPCANVRIRACHARTRHRGQDGPKRGTIISQEHALKLQIRTPVRVYGEAVRRPGPICSGSATPQIRASMPGSSFGTWPADGTKLVAEAAKFAPK